MFVLCSFNVSTVTYMYTNCIANKNSATCTCTLDTCSMSVIVAMLQYCNSTQVHFFAI